MTSGPLTSKFIKSKPAAPKTESGAPKAAPSSQRTAPVKSNQKGPVRTMQLLMAELGAKISANSQTVYDGLKNHSFSGAAEIKQLADGFSGTSAGGFHGNVDGIWGRNTKSALEYIKSFIQKAGFGTQILILSGEGDSPYKDMEEAGLIKAADSNIANLGRLFQFCGFERPSSTRKGSSQILDNVYKHLTAENTTSLEKGGVAVTFADFKNIISFFMLLQQLTVEEVCKDTIKKSSVEFNIEKIARIILDNSIVRLSQTAADSSTTADVSREKIRNWGRTAVKDPGDPEKETRKVPARPVVPGNVQKAPAQTSKTPTEIPQPQSEGDKCINQIEWAFRWFGSRARFLYNQLVTLQEDNAPHPVKGGEIANEDISSARKYMDEIARLYRSEWLPIIKSLEKVLSEKGSPYITARDLNEAVGGGFDVFPGAARTRGERDGTGSRSGSGFTISDSSYGLTPGKGPIQSYINLFGMEERQMYEIPTEGDVVKEYTGGELPGLDYNSWRSKTWQDLSFLYIKKPTDVEILSSFTKFATAVRNLLVSTYNNWRYQYSTQVDDQVLRKQEQELSKWISVINHKIRLAQKSMPESVDKAAERENIRRDSQITDTGPQQYADTRKGRKAQKINQRKDKKEDRKDQRQLGREQLQSAKAR